MTQRLQVSIAVAKATGDYLGLDWTKSISRNFAAAWRWNWSTARRDPERIVAGDVLVLTGKVTHSHLKEFRDYYSRLEELEFHAVA